MQYHTDIIPIRRNMLRDKVNLGTPGTSSQRVIYLSIVSIFPESFGYIGEVFFPCN
jgi:hypothetical protein